MTLSDAAASFAKLVATDTEFFHNAIGNQHDKIDWVVRQRALAHKAVDKLFDVLEKAAKADLQELLEHTSQNGLVTIENLEQVKGTENVSSDNQ